MEPDQPSPSEDSTPKEAFARPTGLTLNVFGLAPSMNQARFQRKLKDLGISFTKCDKIFKRPFGKVKFSNQEDRLAAYNKLNGLQVEDDIWKISLPADMGGESGAQLAERKLKERTEGSRKKSKTAEDDGGDAETRDLGSEVSEPPKEPSVLDNVASWHSFDYPYQLMRKERDMKGIMDKIVKKIRKDSSVQIPYWLEPVLRTKGSFRPCPLLPVISAPNIDGYRNKSEFTIGKDAQGNLCVGFMQGSFKDGSSSVGNPTDAPIISNQHKEIRNLFQDYLVTKNLPTWERQTHTGFWRLLLVRSTVDGNALVMLQINKKAVSNEIYDELKRDVIHLVENVQSKEHNITSVWIQDYDGVSNAAPLNTPKEHIWGDSTIQEELLGTKFRISPTSFFQVNTPGAAILYELVRQWCGMMDEHTTIFDVCCGTGTIGLCIAKNSTGYKEIVGLELIEDAVKDAIENAKSNNLPNTRFIAGKAEETLLKVIDEYDDIKVYEQKDPNVTDDVTAKKRHNFIAILDPPRDGVHPRALRALRACEAITTIIYVSCNPNSLIEDASVLCRQPSANAKGTCFIPIKAQPIDLFPHTPHCELVMMFQRHTEESAQAVEKLKETAAQSLIEQQNRQKRGYSDMTTEPAKSDASTSTESAMETST